VDGRVEGDIQSTGDVSIGESGFFEGEIKAAGIVVSGHMQGKIDCQRLEIVATGHVHGELITDDLIIESGGRFIGESKIRSDNTVQLVDAGNKNRSQHEHAATQTDQDVSASTKTS